MCKEFHSQLTYMCDFSLRGITRAIKEEFQREDREAFTFWWKPLF